MSGTGRKRDVVWLSFEEIRKDERKGVRAKCKKCGSEMEGQVVRMKKHLSVCNPEPEDEESNDCTDNDSTITLHSPVSSTLSPQSARLSSSTKERPTENLSLNNFLTRTSGAQKESFDLQIGRFIYATNSSFRIVENPQFIRLIQLIRPGYRPPSRDKIANEILDKVYEEEKQGCSLWLKGQTVCMGLDGWSNIHNEPIICVTITTKDGNVYLADTVDTSGNPHNAEYLTQLAVDCIDKSERELKVKIRSVVTDNAANVAKMRRNLESNPDVNIIAYGCSAHALNLLMGDMDFNSVKKHIIEIVKYFRNNHFANAEYRSTGEPKLVLPSDVRWNSMVDCLEVYIAAWATLVQICDNHKAVIDKDVSAKVTNVSIKRKAEDMLRILKPIEVALDLVQKDKCTISDAVDIWKKLKNELQAVDSSRGTKSPLTKYIARYNLAITPAHLLAFMLDPTKEQKPGVTELTAEEKSLVFEFAQAKYKDSDLLPLIVKFQARALPFQAPLFEKEVTSNVCAYDWWKSQETDIEKSAPNVFPIIEQLMTAQTSSASVERIFSAFGLVHSDIRNKLGTEKAGKLVFLLKMFNKKSG